MITLYIIYRCRKFILQQKQKRAEAMLSAARNYADVPLILF